MSNKLYGLMADLHLHEWTSFASSNAEGQNSRLVALLNEIWRCAKEVHVAGGDHVIMAGDIFHVRGAVAPSVLNSLRDTLQTCHATYNTKFTVLAGNHDIQHKDTTRLGSAVTALESYFVQTINRPTYIVELDIALVPWVEKIDDLKLAIEALGVGDKAEFRKDTDLILHAPIDGVIKGLPMHGLTPEYLAGLGFRRVFSGHYHNHKLMHPSLVGGGGRVYSIGALAHHTWSDIGTKAGFLLVTPEQVDWKKSHLPEFIDLSQLVDVEPDEIPLLVDQNYVRVRVEASKSREVEAARKELLDMGAKAVIVQAQPKPPAREGMEGTTSTARIMSAAGSLEVSVAEFIKAMGVPAAAVDLYSAAALDVLLTVDEMGE